MLWKVVGNRVPRGHGRNEDVILRANARIVVECANLTIAIPRPASTRGTLEPQVRQNTCVKYFASGTLYVIRNCSPRVKRKASGAVTRFEACAAEYAFLQRLQWQFAQRRGLPSMT